MKSFAKAWLLAALGAFAATPAHADKPEVRRAGARHAVGRNRRGHRETRVSQRHLAERYGKTSNGLRQAHSLHRVHRWLGARRRERAERRRKSKRRWRSFSRTPGVKYVEGLLRRLRARQGKESAAARDSGQGRHLAGSSWRRSPISRAPTSAARSWARIPAVAGRSGVGQRDDRADRQEVRRQVAARLRRTRSRCALRTATGRSPATRKS